MKNHTWIVAATFLIAITTAPMGRAQTEAAKKPTASEDIMVLIEEGVPGGIIIETQKISAEVVAIDHEARTATLKGPEGNLVTVAPGPEAINFNQIKKGDLVRVEVATTLQVYIGDEIDEMLDGAEAMAVLAGKGERPGGYVAETVQTTATVTAVDLDERTATLKFKDGSEQIVQVRPDIDLAEGHVGQKVVIQSTTEIAVDVVDE